MIAALAIAAALSSFQNVKVLKILDGDTLTVELSGEAGVFSPIGVRIQGIDSAEIHDKRPCIKKQAQLARDGLSYLLSQGKVDLNFCAKDKYFRLLCSVRVNEKYDAADYMLTRELARPYFGDKKKGWTCKP